MHSEKAYSPDKNDQWYDCCKSQSLSSEYFMPGKMDVFLKKSSVNLHLVILTEIYFICFVVEGFY